MNMIPESNQMLDTSSELYKVTASLKDSMINSSSSVVSGDHGSDLFTPKKNLGKMDFLKLLTTQLQFQDPMSPMENTEFISQLAQFSALEGTNNVESALANLDTSFKESLSIQNYSAQSMTNASAVSLIGKKIRLREIQINYYGNPDETVPIRVHLGDLNNAAVEICNQDGEVIRTLCAENKDAENSVSLSWDGKTDSGEYAKRGKYTLHVVGEEKNSALYCFVEDVVQGVRYADDGPLIKVGGKELSIGNIMDISMIQSSVNSTQQSGIKDTNALLLLDKKIRYAEKSPTYSPKEGQFLELYADMGGFHSAMIQVTDKDGAVVHSFSIETASGNIASVKIPCVDHNKNGPYSVSFAGNSSGYFFNEGKVEGIVTIKGVTHVRVNGKTIPLSEIIEVAPTTLSA